MLESFGDLRERFVKVFPADYKRVLAEADQELVSA